MALLGRGADDVLSSLNGQVLDAAAAPGDDQEIGTRHRSADGERIEAAGWRRPPLERPRPGPAPARPRPGAGKRFASRCRMSRMTAPVGEVTTPITSGNSGMGFCARGVEQASAASFGGDPRSVSAAHRFRHFQALDHQLVFRAFSA